jgi:hypothetical protein
VAHGLDFEQVLNSCLDRLQAGDSIQACLASYPAHADELAPLLGVAVSLRLPDNGPMMTTEGFESGQARLLAHAAGLQSRRPAQESRLWRGTWMGLLTGTRRLAVASLAGVLLLCGVLSAGTVSAAAGSLPGSPLYPVKRATEAVVSAAAFTPRLQTRVHLAWAERRLREIETLVEQDGAVDEGLLADLEQETQLALLAAEESGRIQELEATAGYFTQQQVGLSRVIERASPAAKPVLMRALQASEQAHERARSALQRAKGPGPPDTPLGQDKDTPPGQDKGIPPGQDKGTPPGQDKGQGPPGKESEAPSGGDTAGGPASSSASQDGLHPPGQGQGQDNVQDEVGGPGQGHGHAQDQIKDEYRGKGRGPAKDQDASEGSTPGQGHGYGQDKIKDNQGKAVGPGVIPGQDKDSAPGNSDGTKPDGPPGQDKDKTK